MSTVQKRSLGKRFVRSVESSQQTALPRFGFILVGGALVGAQVRDVMLANELVQRGYPVHAWWAFDRPRRSPLHASIEQRWLFHSFRFLRGQGARWKDMLGRLASWPSTDEYRARYVQARPHLLEAVLQGLVQHVCEPDAVDLQLARRFAGEINTTGVTHLLPNLTILGPFAAAARPFVNHDVRTLITFQGYELYANYARTLGLEDRLYQQLRSTVEQSDWPAIAVSAGYAERIQHDIGLDRSQLTVIPPGVRIPESIDADVAKSTVQQIFPEYDPQRPLVSYLGRKDAEKGLDLLLYATDLLRRQGQDFQLAICGPTAFGGEYANVCRQIANNLRCPVLWNDQLSADAWKAMLTASHCVVYPSIHAEPFGMVPVEAMAHGTPCIVPDSSGVAEIVSDGVECGGLIFRSADSGHLAAQLRLLLEDHDLHQQLSQSAPTVARQCSAAKLCDRVLGHLDLPLYHSH